MNNKKNNKPETCRLCRSYFPDFKVIGDFVYAGAPEQKFYHCPNCDVGFLYPAMDKEAQKEFYAKEFEKFMEKRAGSDFDWSGPQAHCKSNEKQYKRRLPFFNELVCPGKKVLEVGCSSGFMLLPLKERGLEVMGVEPSSGFANFLKNNDIEVFESLEALKNSQYGSVKFDMILHFFVLEHTCDPVGFLQQGLDFLAPGGTMVFEVPNRSDPLISIYNIAAFDKFYWSVAHNYYFNKESLEYVLRNTGCEFEIIPEQRYDLSNHITWALEGRPGGQGRYSSFFTEELEESYLRNMKKTGYCDTLIGKIYKKG